MKWNESAVRRILDEMRDFGDDFTLIEVKTARDQVPQNLPETTCAFANMPDGGPSSWG